MNVSLRLDNRSRVKGDFYARICERLRGKFPGSTRLVILCKSERSAERTLTNIIPYIEEKLFLKVNREKTVVAYIRDIRFLGYSFYEKGKEGRLRIHPKSVSKMKDRIKELTSRSNGWGDAKRKETLKQYITGWVN